MAEEDGEEFEMDTEISRRILATTKYVSYGALQKNNVPCSKRGASYYNCQNGAQANPYSRGCSRITRAKKKKKKKKKGVGGVDSLVEILLS
ncbi:PROTEIN RALF-LIKE 33 [Salix purpurea]|uniref:PROTEIN RALF-LIKE 33 n=1 Tax=Salix purpurea TaxID=77065 RepID=A0A9Q0W928_SALPP|nr:PROTEIN RALF-LIKE 33 [Salix purpurea]